VNESGALERTRKLAHEYAAKAKHCINGQRDSEYGRALLTLPDFILEREN
jgi:geranylgeranyl pyrophosphate synthase